MVKIFSLKLIIIQIDHNEDGEKPTWVGASAPSLSPPTILFSYIYISRVEGKTTSQSAFLSPPGDIFFTLPVQSSSYSSSSSGLGFVLLVQHRSLSFPTLFLCQ